MRISGLAFAFSLLILFSWHVSAQTSPPHERMQIFATTANTWNEGSVNVVQVKGPVVIKLDQSTLSADDAVIWIQPSPSGLLGDQQIDIALLGKGKLQQTDVTRTGERLFVTATVRGEIRIDADKRIASNLHDSPTYQAGLQLRPVDVRDANAQNRPPASGGFRQRWRSPESTQPPQPTAPPIVQPKFRLDIQFKSAETRVTNDGKLSLVISGGMLILYHDAQDNLIEFTADRAVLFSSVTDPKDVKGDPNVTGIAAIKDKIVAVYLEGDVRVNHVPSDATRGEQRMTASRVYYEFGTDRAILTDAVLHTVDPKKQIPVFVRAQILRQISQGEYRATNGQLATSGMINPSYALAAEKIYVKRTDSGEARIGTKTDYSASNVTLRAWGAPVLYTPGLGGSMDERGNALREISIENSTNFGFGGQATLGIYELLGKPLPADFDPTLKLGYFSERGPAGGIDAKYGGGFVSETTGKPWNFQGDFHSYVVNDKGEDRLGGSRSIIDPADNFRGTFLWQHQHYFPDDWSAQLRVGYVTDATFLEQWFEGNYDNDLPRDMSLYLKRQRETEAFTLFANFQPSDVVTSSEYVQEQFEVEHLPEVGYYRIGDSLANDALTFFSFNTVGGYKFSESETSLADQGFSPTVTPGLPSLGTTGITGKTIYRADLRQEINAPFSTAHLRWVPYVFGRYTGYTDSPNGGGDQNRFYTGVGTRVTTQFWGVDDTAQSDLFDIHRIRHVIEPELNVYASAQSVDRDALYQFEEQVDEINDISALQLALHQRWQTKRGGPGRWRSVDVFTLNISANFFNHKPDDALLNPLNFRGMFFSSLPEASVPRDSVNVDATWRVTDQTAVLADLQQNLDEHELATASVGMAIQRGDSMTFFVGTRYIEELSTNITSVALDYAINEKYLLSLAQSFDFGNSENVSYNFGMTRKFDRFFVGVRFYYSQSNNDTGFTFNLFPYGMGRGLGVTSSQLENRE